MRNERLRILLEISLTVALCAALSWVSIRLPININGGAVSLSMLPIFVLALRRGVWPAVIAGAVYGCVDYLIEPFFRGPLQFVLDYPLAFGLLGLAGLAVTAWRRPVTGGAWLVLATALACTARFGSHFLSGLLFFGDLAPKGQPVWLYSLIYNASYMVPSAVFCIVALMLVMPVLERAVPSEPLSLKPA